MLNMIFKKYTIILLSILFFGALQPAVAQETDDALDAEVIEQEAEVIAEPEVEEIIIEPEVEEIIIEPAAEEAVTEAQAPVEEKRVRGRGGRGWGVGSSYTSTSVIAYAIRTSIADKSESSRATAHNAVPSLMYRDKRHISYRFITSQFHYSDSVSETKDGSSYKLGVNFSLGNDRLITNLHPFGGRFYFALGIADFELKFGFDGEVQGEASETQKEIVNIGGTNKEVEVTVKAEVSGNVGGSLGYEGLGTYTGLGWGTKHPDKRGFGMRFEIGIIQMPKPKATLYVNNFKAGASVSSGEEKREINTTAIDEEIDELTSDTAKYERELEEDAAQLDQFPVIEIGFSYHF